MTTSKGGSEGQTETVRPVVCFFSGSHGDWGGASRVLFTNLRRLDLERLDPIVLLPQRGPIEAELRQLGIRYLIWGALEEPGSPVAYVRRFIRTLLFLRRERVDLIHLNQRSWRPAEILAGKVLGIPILVHIHMTNELASPSDRLVTAAIAVSEYAARVSAPASLQKFVIHNPVDLARFAKAKSMRSELEIGEGEIVVSFLGQIRENKGVEDFVAMAHQFVSDTNLVFLIAGECRDPLRFPGALTSAQLEALINGNKRVRHLGYVERVEDVYATSDIVVVPSRLPEALGLIAIEAGACGKPVIGTKVGGIPEVIDDGVTGYLIEPEDVHRMVELVRKLASDESLRARMGQAGRDRVETVFSDLPTSQFEDLLLSFATRDR